MFYINIHTKFVGAYGLTAIIVGNGLGYTRSNLGRGYVSFYNLLYGKDLSFFFAGKLEPLVLVG